MLPEEIRRKNLYRDGNTKRIFDMRTTVRTLRFCNIREIWDELYQSSDFERRDHGVARSSIATIGGGSAASP